MRLSLLALLLLSIPAAAFPQTMRGRVTPASQAAAQAEAAVGQAIERFGDVKAVHERDLVVLRHVKKAENALDDAMQPMSAVQKAYDEISEANRLTRDAAVRNGTENAKDLLEEARKSPTSADFDKLRNVVRIDARGPASRLVRRNALSLEEEMFAWLRLQERVSQHVRSLSELASEDLRAAIE